MHPGDSEVRELTLAFSEFSLHISVTLTRTSATGSGVSLTASASEEVTPAATASESGPGGLSLAEIEGVIGEAAPDQLAQIRSPRLTGLALRLRSSHPIWTPAARIGRAFRAGLIAARHLEGQFCDQSSPGIPFQNQIYIVLRAPRYPEGCWTESYSAYREVVNGPTITGFAARSVSHSFPSHSEAEAFLFGAGRQWPLQLPQ